MTYVQVVLFLLYESIVNFPKNVIFAKVIDKKNNVKYNKYIGKPKRFGFGEKEDSICH